MLKFVSRVVETNKSGIQSTEKSAEVLDFLESTNTQAMLNALKDQNFTTKDLLNITDLPIKKQIYLLENHVELLDTLLGQFEELGDERLQRIKDDPNLD